MKKINIRHIVLFTFIFSCLLFENILSKIQSDKVAYINGSIHTFNKDLSIVDSLLVENGLITKVGPRDLIINEIDEGFQIIDLKGKMMMPSFHDAHSHPMEGISFSFSTTHFVELGLGLSERPKCIQNGY